jgi:hypothetical protein
MTAAESKLLMELYTLVQQLALRAERENPSLGPRDPALCDLLARADLATWEVSQVLEPLI